MKMKRSLMLPIINYFMELLLRQKKPYTVALAGRQKDGATDKRRQEF